METLVAVDIGGTFTDIIVLDPGAGTVRVEKVPATPDDPSRSVRAAIRKAGVDLAEVARFFHGTTLGINTVLERKGARTGLITTRGFRDILEIRRMYWPMYRLHWVQPEPLVPRDLRLEVTERVRADGVVLHELDTAEVADATRYLLDRGVESIAVSFLNAYAYPEHEQCAGERIATEFDVDVTLSHELTREYREYERTATTVVDAMIRPRLSRYFAALAELLAEEGLGGRLLVTRSDGGVMGIEEARRRGIRTLLSGPASGVMGAAALSRKLGLDKLIAADMGGTSFDAALIVDHEPTQSSLARVEDVPLLIPVVDISTIGAGGGSVAWIDAGGALNVGPRSAGADPGPICYGNGGQEPTFTDAAVVSRLLDPEFFLGGEIELDFEAAERGIAREVGKPLGLSATEAASGIVAVAEAKMAATLEEMTIGRGNDPREFALLAYGGGGPLVANALAKRLEIPRIVVPRSPGAFSASGMLSLDEVRDFARTSISALDDVEPARVLEVFAELEAAAADAFDRDGIPDSARSLDRVIDMRYENQEHTLPLRVPPALFDQLSVQRLRALFDDQYVSVYGYSMSDPVEVVTYRLRAVGLLDKAEQPRLAAGGGDAARAHKGTRRATHRESGGEHEWGVYDRELLGAGNHVPGPAIIEEASATTLVLPGYGATVDPFGNLFIEPVGARP